MQGLLRSIIYQIVTNDSALFNELINSNNSLLRTDKQAWTERRLISVLHLLLDASVRTRSSICLFIDGLDEYGGDQDLLMNWINGVNETVNIKICVLSRPEEYFRRSLQHMPQLRLQDLTYNDIRTYIFDRLEKPLITCLGPNSCTDSLCQRQTSHDCAYVL